MQPSPQLSLLLSRLQLLSSTHSSLLHEHQSLSLKLSKLTSSTQLIQSQISTQTKKTQALFLLCSELQRKHDAGLFETKIFERNASTISDEKSVLKELLVKQGQEIELYNQLNSFLKGHISGNSTRENMNAFMTQQAQQLAKSQSKFLELKNPNLTCRRRWSTLSSQTDELLNRVKTLKQQLQRQQTNIKERYEQYLNKVNKYNTRLVYLGSCGDGRVVSEHLVEGMSLGQRERKAVEEEYQQLKKSLREITEEYQRAKQNKKVLLDFFSNDNQETKLSNSMRLRILQLQDLFHDSHLSSLHPKHLLTHSLTESIKDIHKRLKDRLEFLKTRFEESLEGKVSVEQVEVARFFNGLFVEKDERMGLRGRVGKAMKERVEELVNEKVRLEERCGKVRMAMEGGLEVGHGLSRGYKREQEGERYEYESSKLRSFTFNKSE